MGASVYFGPENGPRERKCTARESGRCRTDAKHDFEMKCVQNAMGGELGGFWLGI